MNWNRFPITTVVKADAKCVWIVDEDKPGRMSVTNAADEVTERLIADFGADKRFFYRDTTGRWDELAHDGTRFTGFVAGTSSYVPPEVK